MKNTIYCFGDSLTVGWQLKPYTEILEELITDGKKVVNNQYFYNVVAKCVYNKGVELGYWK